MSNLEQLTPEEKSEVVKIAARIREEEQARAVEAQEQKAFVDAAQEMDISQEYLQRAAAELQQTRIINAQIKLKRRRAIVASTVGVVVLAGFWKVTHLPPPVANTYTFSAQQWKLNANPETQANISFQNLDGRSNVAVIHVDKFVPRASDGQYFVNLDAAPTVNSLSGYKTTSFFVRGGGLADIRLYLEANATERWRSPAIQLGADWQKQAIDLTQYEHQVRETPSSQWHNAGANEQPGHVDKLSFKVGNYMNDVNASGDVAIDDLEIH